MYSEINTLKLVLFVLTNQLEKKTEIVVVLQLIAVITNQKLLEFLLKAENTDLR